MSDRFQYRLVFTRSILILFWVFFSVLTSYAQPSKADSLFGEMNHQLNIGNLDLAFVLADSSYKYTCLEKPNQCDYMKVYLGWYKARILMSQLKFSKSRKLIEKLLEDYDKLNIEPGCFYSRLVYELGNSYHGESDYERARSLYFSALEFKPLDDKTRLMIHQTLAEMYLVWDKTDSALYHSDIVVAENRKGVGIMGADLSQHLMYSAMIMAEMGQFEVAEKRALEALDKYQDHYKIRLGYAYALGQFSHIYSRWGKYKEALQLAKRAREVYEQVNGYSGWYFDFLLDESFNYYQLGYIDSAFQHCVKVPGMVKAYTSEHCSFLSLKAKEIFTNKNQRSRNYMLSLLEAFNNRYPEYNREMYDYINFYKGYSMKSLKRLKEFSLQCEDEEIRELFTGWNILRTQYYQKLAQENISGIELRRHQERLERIEVELSEKLNLPVLRQNAEYISCKHVIQQLGNKEVAVEVFRFKDAKTREVRYGALILTAGSSSPTYVKLCLEEELTHLMERKPGETDYEYCQRMYEDQDLIFRLIWEPVIKQTGGFQKVYISCSGLLHRLAHDVILERFYPEAELVNLNSSSAVRGIKDEVIGFEGRKTLLFGGISYDLKDSVTIAASYRSGTLYRAEDWNFLTASEKEVEAVAQIIKNGSGKVHLYKYREATEEVFKREVKGSSPVILHIATHGISRFMRENRFTISQSKGYAESGLVMAGATVDTNLKDTSASYGDGILSAPEIVSLNMPNAQLVVLSACESGLGDISNTDEVYGLQRAFKIAGADYILYTLWKVSDEASKDFMVMFYQSLSEGIGVRKAFNQSKKRMRLMEQYRKPFYWGAYQLIY